MRFHLSLAGLVVCLLGVSAAGADDAAALLRVIQSPDASDVDRANAFEKIGNVVGGDAVKPLAGYLGDKKWSHYARFALQKMNGREVTQTLLESLDALQGDLKIGLIVTIGRRRDAAAVAPLAKLLADADAQTAAAAAAALANIGTADAATALVNAFPGEKNPARKASLASALLRAGQRLVGSGKAESAASVFDLLRRADIPKAFRIAATQSAILARGERGVDLMVEQLRSSDRGYFDVGLAVARVLSSTKATEAVTHALGAESSPGRQVLLILALKDRGDRRALPAVLARLKSESPAVELAAIGAVGALGDGSSVPTLLSAAKGDTLSAALDALVALQGAAVGEALIKAARPPEPSVIAVRALGKRRAQEAVELLFELSRSDSAAVRGEAVTALGSAAPESRFPELLALLKTARDAAHKSAIQAAVHAAIIRSTQPDACAETLGAMIAGATGADREFLFEQVRTAGGAKAVALMRRFATGSDAALQDAATKTLGEWLSADAGPVLLEVAKGKGRFAHRALAGYIRLFRQFELPEPERVAMAAEALKAASRADERNAAMDAMTRFPCLGTYELALGQLSAKGSETAAAKAALTIARTVLDLDPQKGKAGLHKIIDANLGDDITAAAKALLQ